MCAAGGKGNLMYMSRHSVAFYYYVVRRLSELAILCIQKMWTSLENCRDRKIGLMCLFSLSGIVYFLNDDPRPFGTVPGCSFHPLQSERCKHLSKLGSLHEFFDGRLIYFSFNRAVFSSGKMSL